MLKLAALVCALGVAGLLMVGGCTPESNRTWSESTDFTGFEIEDWSGIYIVTTNLDENFVAMTIYQTGSSLQGFDNFRRGWNGSISGAQTPGINMETGDGPRGTEVIVATGQVLETLTGRYKYIIGQHWASPRTGIIDMLGPGIAD